MQNPLTQDEPKVVAVSDHPVEALRNESMQHESTKNAYLKTEKDVTNQTESEKGKRAASP